MDIFLASVQSIAQNAAVSDAQQTDHPLTVGVTAPALRNGSILILAKLEDLRVAVQCILAERQRNDPQRDAPR